MSAFENGLSFNTAELSPEQKYAYEKFVKGENLFITGPGGTGKTRLIKHFLRYSKIIGKHIDVCAMTGCAAVLLECNASTIHSWSGIKIAKGNKQSVINSVLKNRNAMNAWKKSKGLILDEVSMLSKKIFEILEEVARIVKKNSAPFGGMQIVFSGDFFQLPPIGTDGEPETSEFCFESGIWNKVFKAENIVELKQMFRQRDPLYIEILQEIRKGELSEKNKNVLKTYVNREYDAEKNNGCVPTKLFSLRTKTDFVNNRMFSSLTGEEFICDMTVKKDCITMKDTSAVIDRDTLMLCAALSEDDVKYEVEQLVNNTPCLKRFRYKIGALVMCTVNLDMSQSICNGSQGIIIDAKEINGCRCPVVKFVNGIVKIIEPYSWQSDSYPTISIGQFPLCLSWAVTIHKIQGSTLSIAEIDIGMSIFEYGQSYVALSRIQSLDGLYLSAFDAQKIKANPKVINFYKMINNTVSTAEPLKISPSSSLPSPSGLNNITHTITEEKEEKEQQKSVETCDNSKLKEENNMFYKYTYKPPFNPTTSVSNQETNNDTIPIYSREQESSVKVIKLK